MKLCLISTEEDTSIFPIMRKLKTFLKHQIKRYLGKLISRESSKDKFLTPNFNIQKYRFLCFVLGFSETGLCHQTNVSKSKTQSLRRTKKYCNKLDSVIITCDRCTTVSFPGSTTRGSPLLTSTPIQGPYVTPNSH